MDIRQSQNFAANVNPLNEKKNSNHIKSLIASLILWIGVLSLIISKILGKVELTVGELAGICGGIYAFYLILAMCCNPLFSYLNKI